MFQQPFVQFHVSDNNKSSALSNVTKRPANTYYLYSYIVGIFEMRLPFLHSTSIRPCNGLPLHVQFITSIFLLTFNGCLTGFIAVCVTLLIFTGVFVFFMRLTFVADGSNCYYVLNGRRIHFFYELEWVFVCDIMDWPIFILEALEEDEIGEGFFD